MSTFTIFLKMFSDPLFRGPLLGSVFMCLSMSIVGAIAFVRKQSLLGEVLSHATFPGVAVGMVLAGCLFPFSDLAAYICILLGAFLGSFLGHSVIEKLRSLGVKEDASLCYVLASFLGLGALCASAIQQKHVLWFRKIQLFLYGQAATMTDIHIALYGVCFLIITVFVIGLRRPLAVVSFDPVFSHTLGIPYKKIDALFLVLLSLSIVVGLRSVGVLMITGMLVAPAAAAKTLTRSFSSFLVVSSFFGLLSAFLGSYLSACAIAFEGKRFLPLGPTIVSSACLLAFFALLFSPSQGIVVKYFRRLSFQRNCIRENLLKHLWKTKNPCTFQSLSLKMGLKKMELFFSILRLHREGFLQKTNKGYVLTKDGLKKAAYIIRVHRLWELYLIKYLSSNIEKVHQSAEQMEHLITPHIEAQLTQLLENPQHDPHDQPIPQKELL